MTPSRLIIIGILLYILYRLLVGSDKRKFQRRKQTGTSSGGAVQDILVEDPVCHTYIPKGQAVRLHNNKKNYYFCSNECCEKFIEKKGAEE